MKPGDMAPILPGPPLGDALEAFAAAAREVTARAADLEAAEREAAQARGELADARNRLATAKATLDELTSALKGFR